MIPSIAVVRIQNQSGVGAHGPGWSLWGFPIVVPLFVLWIPAVLLAPLVLIVLAAVCIGAGVSFTLAVATFWNLISSVGGTDVRVVADGKRITVRIL